MKSNRLSIALSGASNAGVIIATYLLSRVVTETWEAHYLSHEMGSRVIGCLVRASLPVQVAGMQVIREGSDRGQVKGRSHLRGGR